MDILVIVVRPLVTDLIRRLTIIKGTFQRLSPHANTRNARIICINRRGYPGTTPYTAEESRIITSGSTAERNRFLIEQGLNLATLVDQIIKQCSLPKERGVAIVGWSMGNIFLLALVAAIANEHMDKELRKSLQYHVGGIILWGT